MLRHRLALRRRATVLPLLVFSLVAICGFTALAVDIGLIVVARTHCQNAADAAALAGARTIDGSVGSNLATATSNATAAAMANEVLGNNLLAGEVMVEHGAYHYDANTQTFAAQFPPVAPDRYNLTQVTINHDIRYAFARVFNLSSLNIKATAVAAHRPRDVSIVLDFSGSMNNESDLWNNEAYLGSVNNSPNNSDPIFPQYGIYQPAYSPLARLQCTSADPRVGMCNITQPVLGFPALVSNFYQNARGAGAQSAFTPAPASVTVTNPGGDKHLTLPNSTTPARNWAEVRGGNTSQVFEGYAFYNGRFDGYTQGPGYWGKTFFIWPPDTASDWRKQFFMETAGSYPSFGGPLKDNTKLFNSSGTLNDPPGNYVINYKAILQWIKHTGPNPFPPVLRAGNILYYDQIPSDVQAGAYTHTNANSAIVDPNERFWKEYIDYAIGVWRDPYGNIKRPGTPSCSYGPDFTPGSSASGTGIQITGPSTVFKDKQGDWYIHPLDNPKRPRHRFWFGPMTMIQWLLDTGTLPGTAQDISMACAKLGVQGGLLDIQNNHPNDLVSMILFNRPHYAGEPTEAGAFNQAQYSLSNDYSAMINSLWFPPNSSGSDVRPWDANGMQTPRPHGDYCANTATSYGLMVAYNEFSSSGTLRSSLTGGLGRKGAARLVILETDGMANQSTTPNFTNGGAYNSYYNIRPGDQITPSSMSPAQDAIDVMTRICALTTDNNTGPGYALPRKPVIVHCLGFGAIFEPTAQGTEPANALALLQQLSAIGGTAFPSSVSNTSDPNYFKLCVGTLSERQSKLRTAFDLIMDDGVAVVLVK